MWFATQPRLRRSVSLVVAGAVALAVGIAAHGLLAATNPGIYAVRPLVSDGGVPAAHKDRVLVNAWGLAASPTGPWWTTSEARGVSTLYSGTGAKQLLTVAVPGGPTGVAYYGGQSGFLVSGGGQSDPARFIYACEDGRIRAWTPTVPNGWSKQSEIVVDNAGIAAVFRGVALAGGRLYATDFHNDRVDVFNSRWQRVKVAGTFDDPAIPSWFAPSGIQLLDGHLFVTYIGRAPVDGNDDPNGGYVDEFDLQGHLIRAVARMGQLNEPWGLALAPKSFGRFGGDLLVANFGTGQIEAYHLGSHGFDYDGALEGSNHKPLVVNGVWGIAFGNGAGSGPTGTLFAAAGPHQWRGSSELQVHGLIAAIKPS